MLRWHIRSCFSRAILLYFYFCSTIRVIICSFCSWTMIFIEKLRWFWYCLPHTIRLHRCVWYMYWEWKEWFALHFKILLLPCLLPQVQSKEIFNFRQYLVMMPSIRQTYSMYVVVFPSGRLVVEGSICLWNFSKLTCCCRLSCFTASGDPIWMEFQCQFSIRRCYLFIGGSRWNTQNTIVTCLWSGWHDISLSWYLKSQDLIGLLRVTSCAVLLIILWWTN